jgi:hypothetical protein
MAKRLLNLGGTGAAKLGPKAAGLRQGWIKSFLSSITGAWGELRTVKETHGIVSRETIASGMELTSAVLGARTYDAITAARRTAQGSENAIYYAIASEMVRNPALRRTIEGFGKDGYLHMDSHGRIFVTKIIRKGSFPLSKLRQVGGTPFVPVTFAGKGVVVRLNGINLEIYNATLKKAEKLNLKKMVNQQMLPPLPGKLARIQFEIDGVTKTIDIEKSNHSNPAKAAEEDAANMKSMKAWFRV